MRPNGGKYPGILTDEVDRSLDNVYESPGLVVRETVTLPAASDLSAQPSPEQPVIEEPQPEALGDIDTDIKNGDPIPIHDAWIHLDGRHRQHKKTIICIVFDPTHDINYQNTHDRLLHV